MKKFTIENFYELASEMYTDVLYAVEDVAFIGRYEDVTELVTELLNMEDVTIDFISLMPEIVNGYNREYLVVLNEDLTLQCEPVYQADEQKYLGVDSDIVYIADDCNSSILKQVHAIDMYEVSYDFDEDYKEEFGDGLEEELYDCDGNCESCALGYEDDNENNVTTQEDEAIVIDISVKNFENAKIHDVLKVASFLNHILDIYEEMYE